jgi:hypothetical protein
MMNPLCILSWHMYADSTPANPKIRNSNKNWAACCVRLSKSLVHHLLVHMLVLFLPTKTHQQQQERKQELTALLCEYSCATAW